MKTLLIAIVLAASTLNAFSAVNCSEVEGRIETEAGNFRMKSSKYAEVDFASEDHIYNASNRYTTDVLVGGMKKNMHGYVTPIVPVQYEALMVAAHTADFMIDKFSKYVFDIKTHEYSEDYHSMSMEYIPGEMMNIPQFSSIDQPLFAKGIIRKISKKLDKVKVTEENAKFIACAKEQLQILRSLVK